jgi:8-amino-7-oxononanoate synthase
MSDNYFAQQLASLKDQGLLRDLAIFPDIEEEGPLDKKISLNFSSNDYLGLARDQRLKDAAVTAINRFGSGATASRLLAGNLRITEELETNLARMMGTESALVFGSGFLTNLGVLSAVTEAEDEIYSDWLNHASIIDGIRLSHAHRFRYRHKDLNHLESLLKDSTTRGKRIIVSESLFSMDGDIAPVHGLAELAVRYQALLIIDEAHAVGIFGGGGGICRTSSVNVHPGIVIGTLSKALGGYGGFVASSRNIRDFLINRARSFIYSTGLPPACIASAQEAVSIVTKNPELGDKLMAKTRRFRKSLEENGFKLPAFESQIIQIPIGSNEKAMQFSRLIINQGIFIRAIRPPTVPPGTARVRLSLNLSMTESALRKAASIMSEAARQTGLIK